MSEDTIDRDADELSDEYDLDGAAPGTWSTWQVIGLVVVVGLVVALLAVLIADRTRTQAADSVDVGFLQDMIAHHEQAVQMGVVTAAGAADDSVRHFGQEAVIAQQWEIGYMVALLEEWGYDTGDPERDAMAWMGMPTAVEAMPGMATAEQIEAMRRASGEELDEMFLSVMRAHHVGGIHMARDAAERANDPRVRELAERMVRNQGAEIAEYDARWQALGLG